MKQITAIFRPHRLEQVEQALHALPNLPGFTLHAARGHARGHGAEHQFTPDKWNPDAHDKLVLVMFCADNDATEVLNVICRAARTGNAGDGMVAMTELVDLVRIRTGERGNAAA